MNGDRGRNFIENSLTNRSKVVDYNDIESAKADFFKKFSDKTKNKWDDRENFKKVNGKYDIVEVSHDYIVTN